MTTREKYNRYRTLSFWDRVLPGVIRFFPTYAIVGNSFRSIWAIKEYPPTTLEQGLLKELAAKQHVTVHTYIRPVGAMEQRQMIHRAAKTNNFDLNNANINEIGEAVNAEENINDITDMLRRMRKNKESLSYIACFIEIEADSRERLEEYQSDVLLDLENARVSVDKLYLRQMKGFMSTQPFGNNFFRREFERPVPISSAANLYPLSYAGKTDPYGLEIGKDRFGSRIVVDFNTRTGTTTNGNIVILGNPGMGKSWLAKLIYTNLVEQGYQLFAVDPEGEYQELFRNLGGTYIDYMSGNYIINLMEPKRWKAADDMEEDKDSPDAFQASSILTMHISFLKDFFRVYKNLSQSQLDVLEIFLSLLYEQKGIHNENADEVQVDDWPILEELYELIDNSFQNYVPQDGKLYTLEDLRVLMQALYSICKGVDSKFFNGTTNCPNGRLVCFGVKEVMDADPALKNAVLFNLMSFCANKLLVEGNSAAGFDEYYLYLDSPIMVKYTRNLMKRDRKKESMVLIISQNIEDYLQDSVASLTKPLLSIPSHSFLFYPGNVDAAAFRRVLQLEDNEWNIISGCEKGSCLYRCGNERYHLEVKSPEWKSRLFGKGGGR